MASAGRGFEGRERQPTPTGAAWTLVGPCTSPRPRCYALLPDDCLSVCPSVLGLMGEQGN